MNAVMNKLRPTCQIALGAHLLITLTSVTYGTGIFRSSSSGDGEADVVTIAKKTEVFDAHHYSKVTDLVSAIYSGNMSSSRSWKTTVVALDENATFEDPVAICARRTEVQEAFRALSFVHPQSLSKPKCVDVKPKGRSIELTYALHQNYNFGSLFGGGGLEVRSLLMMEVHLERIIGNDVAESKFVVTRMEERWNGVKPLENYLFWIVRRINGLLSYSLTTRLLADN